jgi:hypothetical protein
MPRPWTGTRPLEELPILTWAMRATLPFGHACLLECDAEITLFER